ncbi:MAG: IS3 family transposase [Thermomicrobiales bacterium]|nr:IS3 family transposase [Thermomicrobiales bacterium]
MHRFIAAEKVNHSVSMLCRVLEVSRSGYYASQRRPACRRDVEDRRLGELIAREHKRSRETYGAPRIHTQLTRAGERVGRKRVARLMRQRQLSGLVPRRKGKTTIRVPGITTSPDLVRREWNPTEPNHLWVADITYVRTWEGWLYLAAVVDCFSRKVVGWSIADHLRAELVVDAVGMAISRRRPAAGLVHHSDHGSQYVSLAMGNHLKEAGIDTSMGSRGSPLDNAVAESFFATFKKDLINRRSWPEKNETRSAIFEWIEVFYNRIRLHTTIGSYAPDEFESLRLSASKEAA